MNVALSGPAVNRPRTHLRNHAAGPAHDYAPPTGAAILAAASTSRILMAMSNESHPIDPRVRIGHVHLKVANLDRSLQFYRDVLGFKLQQRFGTQAAFYLCGRLTIII